MVTIAAKLVSILEERYKASWTISSSWKRRFTITDHDGNMPHVAYTFKSLSLRWSHARDAGKGAFVRKLPFQCLLVLGTTVLITPFKLYQIPNILVHSAAFPFWTGPDQINPMMIFKSSALRQQVRREFALSYAPISRCPCEVLPYRMAKIFICDSWTKCSQLISELVCVCGRRRRETRTGTSGGVLNRSWRFWSYKLSKCGVMSRLNRWKCRAENENNGGQISEQDIKNHFTMALTRSRTAFFN